MATQTAIPPGWQPPGGTTPPTEPPTGPPPQTTTPLDPPQIYNNTKWRVPSLVVKTQEEADALDPHEWMLDPGTPSTTKQVPKPKEQFPKLYYNVNVPPQVVSTADAENALGSEWKEYQFTQALIQSAWQNLQAEQAYQAAQAAAKAQSAQQ
jgi:hypothetical protein